MSVTGIRDTGSRSARRYSMDDTIGLLDAKQYPLMAILTNAGKDPVSGKGEAFKKQQVDDPEFKWYEDEFASRSATTATGQTGKNIASTPDVDVATGEGSRFQAGDIIEIDGSYAFVVTSISTDTLTLSNELGGQTGSIDLSSLTVFIVGNANEEGAGLRDIKGTTPVEKVGYCQIFRTPFGVTETSNATGTLIKENDLDYQRRKKGIEHAVDIERAFLFSSKYKDTFNGKPRRVTEGIFNAITTNSVTSVDTEAEFETALETAFKYGNSEKTMFASPAFVSMINGFAKDKMRLVRSEKTYGITILSYESAHGTLNIIKHDQLTGPYADKAVVLDMENVMYAYLKGRDTALLTDRQANGDDEVVEEYLSEVGLKIKLEKTHCVLDRS